MMADGKRDVLVIYGGRSMEHEISCRSAAYVLKNLDPAKYQVHALAIDKDGRWLPQDAAKLLEGLNGPVPIDRGLAGQPALNAGQDPGGSLVASALPALAGKARSKERLVVFPVLHGTNGEDGTLQGMLELSDVAFVGPDTLGSAIGMDKVVTKILAQAAGVPVVPWIDVKAQFWPARHAEICAEAARTLGFPMFVKPVRLGSSVGITKVRNAAELQSACELALRFDDKIMIEKGLDVREIECAVLGDYDPDVSIPGEVIPHAEFYSYDAKYIDANGASLAIPAKLEPAQAREAQALSKKVFQALELYGMARVDLFLEKATGEFYLNEVNTIPGFTEISQFPLLWQASGLTPAALLDRLVELAVKRQDAKRKLQRAK
jgi:D-alanine-D-alanine ligase